MRVSPVLLVLPGLLACSSNGDPNRDAGVDSVSRDTGVVTGIDGLVGIAGDAPAGDDAGADDAPSTLADGASDVPAVVDAPVAVDVPAPPVDFRPVDFPGFDVGPMAEVRPPTPPPAVNPAARKLLGDGWTLLGTHGSACSHGAASVGQRWCAVSRPARLLGKRDLWVINVTAAATAEILCDGTSPACVRLSEDLYAARPGNGPVYPGSHRFYGDTLIFYASPTSAPGDLFRGTVFSWRPGWPTARAITSANGTICNAHGTAPMATCLENVAGLMEGQTLQYDLHYGPVDLGPLPKMATLYPRHPVTDDTSASYYMTPTAASLVFTTIVPTAGNPVFDRPIESLYFLAASNAGKVPPAKVADNVTRVAVSADQTRWFYLRDYNYNNSGQPSGSLTTSDFPLGTNERGITGPRVPAGSTNGVAAYQVLVDAAGKDAGLGLLVNLAAGRGDYRILPRHEDPATVLNVATGLLGLPTPSPDLRFGLHATFRAFDIATTDFKVTRNDGTGSCSLTNSTTAALFGAPFSGAASLVFWGDNYDQATDSAQGWLANPLDCSGKRMFAQGIDYWFVRGEEMLLFSDAGSGQASSLKVAPISAGQLMPATLLQAQVDRTYAILADWEATIFSLTTTAAAVNGIYYLALR